MQQASGSPSSSTLAVKKNKDLVPLQIVYGDVVVFIACIVARSRRGSEVNLPLRSNSQSPRHSLPSHRTPLRPCSTSLPATRQLRRVPRLPGARSVQYRAMGARIGPLRARIRAQAPRRNKHYWILHLSLPRALPASVRNLNVLHPTQNKLLKFNRIPRAVLEENRRKRSNHSIRSPRPSHHKRHHNANQQTVED